MVVVARRMMCQSECPIKIYLIDLREINCKKLFQRHKIAGNDIKLSPDQIQIYQLEIVMELDAPANYHQFKFIICNKVIAAMEL